MYRFKWPLCKNKCSVGFSMMLHSEGWQRTGFVEVLLPEGCIKKWYDKPSGYGSLSKKCEQGGQWSSDLAVSCTFSQALWHTVITQDSKMLWLSPLTRIHIDVADSSVLPLLFLKSLSIFSGCPVINLRNCHQDRKLSWVGPMEYHPHTGFRYSKVLTCLFHDYVSFINISGMDLDGSG